MRVKSMKIGQELICSKCGNVVNLTSVMKNNECRICTNCHIKRSMRWIKNNPNKHAVNRKIYQQGPAYKKAHQRYRDKNPEKLKARNKMFYAIYSGRMKRLACEVCGNKNSHGHHDDYSKPLEVIWLCTTHHYERHELLGMTI